MDKVKKKGKTRLMVPLFAMISVAFFLLTGCHQGNCKEHPLPPQNENEEQTDCFVLRNDDKTGSLAEDSTKVFYELIPRKEIMHGGMGRSESDK